MPVLSASFSYEGFDFCSDTTYLWDFGAYTLAQNVPAIYLGQ